MLFFLKTIHHLDNIIAIIPPISFSIILGVFASLRDSS